MSENGGGSSEEPPTPKVELIYNDMNSPSAHSQASYNRYGQFVPFYEVYPSDDEEDEKETQPVIPIPDYQVNPLVKLHHTEYKPGTEDWDKHLSEWKDIGQRYKKGPELSLGSILGIKSKPLPQDEIRYFKKKGIIFEKVLGSGAYATVWLVSKTTINQGKLETMRMACKILNLKTYGTPPFLNWLIPRGRQRNVREAVARLVSEAEIHRKLVHKHIVKCKYVFKIQDPMTDFPYCRLLMFMELCRGHLLTLIERSPGQMFSENKAKILLRQVSEGLQYMHDKHICHLDIKPENILFVLEYDVLPIYKISDLGFSKCFDSDQETLEGTIGTFFYMGPEMMSEGAYLPKPADIYSLGCVLAHTLLGPTHWIGFLEALQKCPKDRVPTISSSYKITPICGDLIFRMTNMDPGQRPTIGEVINDSWLTSY